MIPEKSSHKQVLSVEAVKSLELHLAQEEISLHHLMEQAGRALADAVMQLRAPSADRTCSVAVLCGTGNNGGDGWVAACLLAKQGYQVDVFSPIEAASIKAQPAHDHACAAWQWAISHSDQMKVHVDNSPDIIILAQAYDIVIDAILGTGFSGVTVRQPFDAWITWANAQKEQGSLVVAADVPSGMNAQTGKCASPCIKASTTVTMLTSKPGLETPWAFAFCGTVQIASLVDQETLEAAIGSINATHATTNAAAKLADEAPAAALASAAGTHGQTAKNVISAGKDASTRNSEFLRPENEDDDGYDPYSDRLPSPEPLFQSNPWD